MTLNGGNKFSENQNYEIYTMNSQDTGRCAVVLPKNLNNGISMLVDLNMKSNFDDLINNVKNMVNSGNIPPEIQQMMNSMKSSDNNTSSNNSSNIDINKILSQVSPEMINNLSSSLNSNSSNNNSNQNNFNLDMNTILKMKSIMESMNNKNDPRANLLYSLKPYLRESKKDKVDQYVNMLNISKIADFMNKPNVDKKD